MINSKEFKKIQNSRIKKPYHYSGYYNDDTSNLAVTVAVTPEVAFSFFRDFKNLPIFMKDLKSVKVLSLSRSHWMVDIKGLTAEWNAEIINEQPGEMISWRSEEGSEIETTGSIWFTPAPKSLGTIIRLKLGYNLPGGKFTELITKLIGADPKSLAFTNMRRLKCYLETGEIATIEGQSDGRGQEIETFLKH